MKTEIITLSEFGDFCNERACDGCWNIESAIRCIEIYTECMSKPFWKRKRYFQKHYGETITKFVKNTYREIEEKSDGNSRSSY
jgi:hypothetical protein